MARILGGIMHLKINGTVVICKGDFTFGLGLEKGEGVQASSGEVAGCKLTRTIPFIEGEVFNTADYDLTKLLITRNATIVLEIEGGKTYALSGAYFASDGEISTADSAVKVRFEGTAMREL